LEGLKKTAESVINQTWRDFEWIIVDGGSIDGSKEYIEQLAEGLPEKTLLTNQECGLGKVCWWCSEKDKGIYNAMNKGINSANGDYLLFLNSGDWFCSPSVLTRLFA